MMNRSHHRFAWGAFGCVSFFFLVVLLQTGRLATIPAIAAAGEQSTGKAPKRSVAPLQLTPELLQEKLPEAGMSETKPKADNFACYVCHANMEGEPLVEVHAREGHGCIECHGESFAHRNDEDNITPPDVMYPPEAIDAACRKCHDMHDVPAKKVIAKFLERCAGTADPSRVVCTACHGEHRLAHRTVRWDKHTGKLLFEEQSKSKSNERP